MRGSTNSDGGDLADGDNTSCDVTLCAADFHVANYFCVECEPGSTNEAGDKATDGSTDCDWPSVLCARRGARLVERSSSGRGSVATRSRRDTNGLCVFV